MGKNSKLLSLKIPVKIDKILEQYLDYKFNDDDFIFPELKTADFKNPKDLYNKKKLLLKSLIKI